MNPYSDLDAVIDAWVKSVGSTLFTEWAGKPARYFHIPGDPPFECFQVSIAKPTEEEVEVLARAIDANDDTEVDLNLSWKGSVEELGAMPTSAMATIEGWKVRPQQIRKRRGMRYRHDGTPLPFDRNYWAPTSGSTHCGH